METVLILAIAALAGLTALLAVRAHWSRTRGEDRPFPPLIFGLWIVSTVVWNTFFFSFRLPGLFDMSIERVLFLALVASAMFQLRRGVDLRGSRGVELWMGLFLLACIGSMAVNGFDAVHPAYPKPWFIFFSSYLAPFMGFLYAKYFLRDERAIRFVMATFFVLGLYLCLTAFAERAGLRALVLPAYILDPKFPLHLDRARGPLLNAAFNGLAMTIGFAAGVYLLPKLRGPRRALMLVGLALYFPAIFLTYTRSVYLGFIMVIGILLFFYRKRETRWKLAPVLVSLAAVAVVADSGRLLSADRAKGGIAQLREIEIRFQLINRSLHLMQTNPFFGVGLARFTVAESRPEIFQDQQHNHLIGMAVELGLLGLALYLVVLAQMLRHLYALARDPRNETLERTNQIIMLTALLAVNLVTNVFVEPAFCPFINVNTFIFAGLIDKLHDHPELLEGEPALSEQA